MPPTDGSVEKTLETIDQLFEEFIDYEQIMFPYDDFSAEEQL